MARKNVFSERDLAALAKSFRLKSGKRKADAAKDLSVTRPTMQLAEHNPEQSLTRLRIRIIEKYSPYKVIGPVFLLQKK